MKYFCYQQNEKPMGGIWSLFRDLAVDRETAKEPLKGNPEYAHTVEIVNAALNGSLPTNPESVARFNLSAYEYKCRENDLNNERARKGKKELNIVEMDTTTDKDTSVGFGDIADIRLRAVDDVFEELMKNKAFEDSLRELHNIRSTYISTMGIDVVSVLQNALRGIPEAVSKLSEISRGDERLKELFTSLCEDGSGRLGMALEVN